MITIDLRMDAAYIKENMSIKWTCDTGFVENIQKLVKEYKTTRNLIVNLFIFTSLKIFAIFLNEFD